MAYSYLLEREIREDNLSPCYVFYGEETYLADQFINQIRSVLLSPEGEPLHLERFDLAETRWAEILDVARTAPFFFAPWRILLVTARDDSKKKPSAAEEKKDLKKKTDAEAKMMREYLRSPSERTVLVVVIQGRIKKGHALLKPFDSPPPGSTLLLEIQRLKTAKVKEWIQPSIKSSGKMFTPEAQEKLIEKVGNDLRLLDNELKKLFAYAADKRVIDADDVAEVCDWGKEFAAWELASCLEKADAKESLVVLTRLFDAGAAPEYVLGTVAGLFRDLLLARLWLREGQDRKEIFRTLRPKIQEFWTDYQRIFREFFEIAGDAKNDVLGWALRELEKIDTLIKSSDVPAEAMISGFVIDYCRRRRRTKPGREATSGKRG
jgi:DNA polymerase III subunit delta